jgi:hypothetical protein
VYPSFRVLLINLRDFVPEHARHHPALDLLMAWVCLSSILALDIRQCEAAPMCTKTSAYPVTAESFDSSMPRPSWRLQSQAENLTFLNFKAECNSPLDASCRAIKRVCLCIAAGKSRCARCEGSS